MNNNPNCRFCKKLVYSEDNQHRPTILLGLIESEDDFFITFRTARKQYLLSKKTVLSVQDTTVVFRGEHQQ